MKFYTQHFSKVKRLNVVFLALICLIFTLVDSGYALGQCGDPDPYIVTNCYNYANAGAAESIVDFPSVSSGDTFGSETNIDSPLHGNLSLDSQTGSLLGGAFQPTSCTVFFASYLKRHTTYGDLGSGGIYAVDYCGTQTTSSWLDLATLGINTGADPHGQPDDCTSWSLIGTTGLGDMDYNPTNSSLYVVNMENGTLVEIPIDTTDPINNVPTTANEITIPAVSDNSLCDPTNGTMRPMGLGIDANGIVYVGMVCDASLSTDRNDMTGYIFSYNPSNSQWSATPEITIPFNYNRGMVNCCGGTGVSEDCGGTGNGGCCIPDIEWSTWDTNYPAQYVGGGAFNPQPMISDLEFDSSGNMAIGVRDRHGDQIGAGTPLPDCDAGTSNIDEEAHVAGDFLFACYDGISYTLESNGSCNGINGAVQGGGYGLGGGEYFYDNHWNHGEISLGMITYIPQSDQFALAVYDPLSDCSGGFGQFYDQGIVYYDPATGQPVRAYRLIEGGTAIGEPAKGNGIGDLILTCPEPVVADTPCDNPQCTSPNEAFVCSNGTDTVTLAAEVGSTGVEWFDGDGNSLGTNNSINLTNADIGTGVAGQSQCYYYTAQDANSCDGYTCCPVTVIVENCCPNNNCFGLQVLPN